MCLSCQVCAELKPRLCKPPQNTLIKATQLFGRLATDFKGPLPSSTRNICILVVADEFFRFLFCFPCHNMSSQIVNNCLDLLFTLCGIPGCIHSDNASTFVSAELKSYLIKKGNCLKSQCNMSPDWQLPGRAIQWRSLACCETCSQNT